MRIKNKTAYVVTLLLLALLMLSACYSAPVGPGTEAQATAEGSNGLAGTLEASGIIETREPLPTATPDLITNTVRDLAEDTIIEDFSFFGLTGEDWINLFISLVIVVLGLFIGTWVANLLSEFLSRYINDEEAKLLLKKSSGVVRWIIALWALRFAAVRLLFLSPAFKQGLDTLLFVINLVLITRGLWYLIDMVGEEARYRFSERDREQDVAPAITLFTRIARVILIILAMSALLDRFGVNLTAFAALIGLGGLAFSLAARDTIADAIAGVIILLDRPFRVGDRIEISAANTWGDVTDIGLRTTRILTRDNRLVIIPNSLISKNEIINYTYPDPNYRIETHVGIGYQSDIEQAREVMRGAVRQIPAVLPNKPVDILYSEMGDSAMIFRIRWWIGTYADTRRITDQVHTALQRELDAAGIVMPFPTQSIFLHEEILPDNNMTADG